MPQKTEVSHQRSFEDQILSLDPEDTEKLIDAMNTSIETRKAVSDAAAARRFIKETLPAVDKPTRFIIGEQFVILVTPYDAEGHEVRGGKRYRRQVIDNFAGADE